jgi:hypothetical protein
MLNKEGMNQHDNESAPVICTNCHKHISWDNYDSMIRNSRRACAYPLFFTSLHCIYPLLRIS